MEIIIPGLQVFLMIDDLVTFFDQMTSVKMADMILPKFAAF